MKTFLRLFIVSAAVSFSQLAAAREALLEATTRDIKVTSISPEVQDQLKNAAPEERKNLEHAINTGNLFIPQYFSYNAFDADPENKDWEEEAATLIALNREEWMQHYQWLELNSKKIPVGKDVAYAYRETPNKSTR